MRILFAISIVSLLALLWAAFAMARYIRRIRRAKRQTAAAMSTARSQKVYVPREAQNPIGTAASPKRKRTGT